MIQLTTPSPGLRFLSDEIDSIMQLSLFRFVRLSHYFPRSRTPLFRFRSMFSPAVLSFASAECTAKDLSPVRQRPWSSAFHFSPRAGCRLDPVFADQLSLLILTQSLIHKVNLMARQCCGPVANPPCVSQNCPQLRRFSVSPGLDRNLAVASLPTECLRQSPSCSCRLLSGARSFRRQANSFVRTRAVCSRLEALSLSAMLDFMPTLILDLKLEPSSISEVLDHARANRRELLFGAAEFPRLRRNCKCGWASDERSRGYAATLMLTMLVREDVQFEECGERTCAVSNT